MSTRCPFSKAAICTSHSVYLPYPFWSRIPDTHNGIFTRSLVQASSGRQLALSIQDDLTDTDLNVVCKLRQDKLALEDRLAALEQQYNTDLSKVSLLHLALRVRWCVALWSSILCNMSPFILYDFKLLLLFVQWNTELSLYKSKYSDMEEERVGEISQENGRLKQQMNDMRQMFDVTISQTQEECSGYLSTIEQLRQQVCVAYCVLYVTGITPVACGSLYYLIYMVLSVYYLTSVAHLVSLR